MPSALRLALPLATASLALALLFGCSGSGSDPDGGGPDGTAPDLVDVEPVVPEASDFTYRLEESSGSLVLWTTPATHKVTANERAPEATHSGIALAAARNEYEPAVCVIEPGSGSVSVSLAPFASLGDGARVELRQAHYEGLWPERLSPVANGDSITRGEAPTVLWLTVYVPEGAPAGLHESTLVLSPSDGEPVSVPLRLTVFDFALPKAVSFASLLYLDVSGLIPSGGSETDAKDLLFAHRFTPASVPWPSGFNYRITWDSDANPQRCSAFYDEPDEGPAYAIGALARKYLLGEGWNGVGFPDSMLFQFVDNSTPRPETFCGESRGDHFGSAAYNAAWGDYLGALSSYLEAQGMRERSYYYVQNEPQNDEDHRLAAHLCRLTRAAAPGLRIAISEEPKPEIAEDSGGDCGYDIWIAHVRAFQEDYAKTRQGEHGEALWFYSLDHDPDPYFNPTRIDTQGLHARIIPWVSWRYRATGWAYYDAGRFFDGAEPGIRAELLREGFEDYEYLRLANGGSYPRVDVTEPADATALSVASSLTSWTKDADALMALRFELGRYLEGARNTLPVLETSSELRPRAAYYLNFQDPAGAPSAEPLVIEGKSFIKVGWQAYDAEAGLGWSGENIANPSIALYGYDDVAGYSEAARSYVYDDYGRDNLFEFALANGRYRVTVGAGRPARAYPNDPHRVVVEGQAVIDDEASTESEPTFRRSAEVELRDGSLSLEVGGRSPSTGEWAYTFLAYVEIEPI